MNDHIRIERTFDGGRVGLLGSERRVIHNIAGHPKTWRDRRDNF